jgi:hypothetical protein
MPEMPTGYRFGVTLTKSDTVNHVPSGQLADAIWVGGAGVCALVLEDDSVVNVTGAAGSLIPLRTKRLNSTNTTATVVTALFK